jgi:hypothetical protein
MSTFKGAVLALDLATVTGFAYGAPGTAPTFGSYRFAPKGASRSLAYRAFRQWLEMFTHLHKTDIVVYESPAVPSFMAGKTNIDTIKLLIGLAEHLEEWAYDRIELREASVSQVRAHFIGQNLKSAIAKPMTLDRCIQLGWKVESTDEADACALWDYQCSWLRPDLAPHTTPLFSKHE